MARTGIHHVELWVTDLLRARATWDGLLEALGYTIDQTFESGVSWRLGNMYIVLEASPAATGPHDRMRAGLNHLALWAGSRADVERIVGDAQAHSWTLMFPDRHPFAGGADHYAAYLENDDGFQIELVAEA